MSSFLKSYRFFSPNFRRKFSNQPVFRRLNDLVKVCSNETAIFDENGSHTYGQLAHKSSAVAQALIDEKIFDENVSYLCPNDASYAFATFGVWKSGNSCVPLCKSHPAKSMDYYINDSKSRILIATRNYVDKVHPLIKENSSRRLLVLEDIISGSPSNLPLEVENDNILEKHAMLIYTSGTTGSPKGVVLTHSILNAQINNLLEAWKYSNQDCLLHVLPLHHTHGIVNCLLCPLAVGGKVNMLQNFDPQLVWENILTEQQKGGRINLFMAVPTIYAKLIEFYSKNLTEDKLFMGKSAEEIREICLKDIRLMVSGSAALPQPILEAWQKITGHFLLERYGMTELGMVLTNPLDVNGRKAGCVGKPFPNVRQNVLM